MCGLVGVINNEGKGSGVKRTSFMTNGLVADTLRGWHSTGVFYSYGLKPGYYKQAVPGPEYVHLSGYTKIQKDSHKYTFQVGHNRWATQGASDDVNNAHPFIAGPITLVHNGTLLGWDGLITPMTKCGADGQGVAVDSEAIAWNLAQHGVKEVVEALNGAFALIWHDDRDNTINFVRNDERPLWFAKAKNGHDLYFASERLMLLWILDRNQIPHEQEYQLPEGDWLKFENGDIDNVVRTTLDIDHWTQSQYTGGSYGGSSSGNYKTDYSLIEARRCRELDSHPMAAQERLAKEGFSVTDSLPFVPLSIKRGVCVGTIDHIDVPCIVYGMDEDKMRDAFTRRWSVSPQAIRYMEDGTPAVMAIQRHTCYVDNDWEYQGWSVRQNQEVDTNPFLDLTLGNKSEVVDEDDDPFAEAGRDVADVTGVVLIGPLGEILDTTQEWYDLTSKGCYGCDCTPALTQHERVVWLDDANDNFLCGPCGDHNFNGQALALQ